jgi:hypothetical protein
MPASPAVLIGSLPPIQSNTIYSLIPVQWFKLFCDANYGGQENYEPSPISSAKSLPTRAAPPARRPAEAAAPSGT